MRVSIRRVAGFATRNGFAGPLALWEYRANFKIRSTHAADRYKDGVVRWRRVDLQRVIVERFGVE